MSHDVHRSGRNAFGAGSSFPSSSLPSPGSTPAPACVWTLCWPVSWFPLQPRRTVPAVLWCRSQPVSRQRDVAASPRHVTTTTTSWSPGHRDTRHIWNKIVIRNCREEVFDRVTGACPAPAISDRAEKPSTKKSILITFSWVKLNESLVPNIHSVKILSWWHWKPQWTASCCGAGTGQQPSRYKISEIREVHHKQQSDQRR